MPNHSFNFPGGDILSKMSASWFVSYAFFTYVCKSHLNWQISKTFKTRISRFKKSKSFHKAWLIEITKMDTKLLDKNKIGLYGTQVILFAKIILSMIH